MVDEPQASPLAPLGREEYIEQAHFFRALAERLEANVPAQEVLASVREEVLATTKLPLAIDFLLGELRHEGVLGPAMGLLPHYFTPFQAFIVQESENERLRFDLRMGLEILRREAEYRPRSRRGRESFSINSSHCAAIGSATTAAWKQLPAIRRSTKCGAIGFSSCGDRSAWSKSPT